MSVIYRITKIGGQRRGGVNRPFEARVGGLAKTNEEAPFTIANEIVAERLGQFLGLPVPAGVLAQDEEKVLHYFSLNVGQEGKELPPIIPTDFCAEEKWLAAGTVVFDALIANGDRHRENLSRDETFPDEPPRVSIFDHGTALLGTDPPTGRERLDLLNDHLGCVEDEEGLARTSCLIGEPLDVGMLGKWVQRIREIPRFVIDDICRAIAETPGLNVSDEEAQYLAGWIARRASKLGDLICQNQQAFPSVEEWGLWPPGDGP